MDSRLEKAIVEAFDANGPLCRQIEGFKRRDSQLQFAQAVGQAIQTQGVAVVEAGTGTGKTFAYLVPAILSRSKTIVSTASKTLQDQLFEKDVGRICSALAVDADVAVLKGRGNYICKERLERLVDRGLLPEADSYKRLKKIIDFARQDATGDKNDIPGIPEKDPLWPWVTSTKDNCLGKSKCPHYDDCFVNRARARAHEADIVIVNHHLFMADLSLKDDTMAELLPDADLVILDEAHKLPDIGIDYFSDIFSLWELQDFSEEGRLIGKAHAAGVVRWDDVFLDVKKAALNLHQIIHRGLGVEIDTEIEINSIDGFAQSIKKPFEKLIESVLTIAKTFKSLEGSNEECDLFSDRAADLLKRMQDWQVTLTNPSAVKTVGGIPSVLWLRLTEQNVFFSNTPLSLAQPFAKAREKMHNAWILTSATISTRKDDGSADFSYFLGELGLSKETQTYTWDSPFNFAYQARFYLPKNLPGVFEDNFAHELVEATWPLLQKTQGRAFFLCTSFRSMEAIANELRLRMGANFTLCVQGEAPKSELLDRFKSMPNAVLVGSMSFWEGVDMKGDVLQLVVIDKMPFAQFDTPVARAKKDWFADQGKNPFMSYQLPEMITTLRQGVGRLIRSENDFGVIVFGDNRLLQKRYGRVVLESLPAMIRTQEFARVYSFLDNPDEAY